MKHGKFFLALALAFPVALGAGALGSHAEAKEVGAATYTYTYGLINPTVSETEFLEGASATGTVDSESWPSDTVEFTVTLTADDVIRILINAVDDSTWSYKPTYTESIGANYSAFFSENTDGNFVVLVSGSYTFTFNVRWAGYSNKTYGLDITTPTVTERKVTYTAVIGDEGHGLAGTVTLSKVVESVDPTFADYTANTVYGTEFVGWYSDATCSDESAIALTTEVTEDVTVWAKYSYLETNVVYNLDYSAARDQYDTGSVSVNFWNNGGSALSWPGIVLGADGEGVITASVPADATGLQVVSVVSGSAAAQTANVTVAPSATGEIAQVVLDGTYTVDAESGYRTYAAFKADAEYISIQEQLQKVAVQCATSALSNEANLVITTAWEVIEEAVAAGVEKISFLQGVPSRAGSEGMAGLISIYDFCVSKYGLTDHIGRTANGGSGAISTFNTNSDGTAYIALISGAVALIAIGGIVLTVVIRRRRQRAN